EKILGTIVPLGKEIPKVRLGFEFIGINLKSKLLERFGAAMRHVHRKALLASRMRYELSVPQENGECAETALAAITGFFLRDDNLVHEVETNRWYFPDEFREMHSLHFNMSAPFPRRHS